MTRIKLKTKIGGFAVATCLRHWMKTLDYKIAYYDSTTDPARPDFRGRYIHVFWHEYISFPLTIWGNCQMAALVTHHRDGDWITRAAGHLGFEIVRGSTTRGGLSAIRELKRKSHEYNLTLMPDGPQGPRRKMALGAVYLSSRLGIPLVPVGFGYDRPWRLPSWDRFAVPRPHSRARAIFGPPMLIPRKLRRGDLARYCQAAEDMLNRLTEESEQWAGSKTRCLNEQPLMRRDHLRPSVPLQSPAVVSVFSPAVCEHKNADENAGTFRRAS